MKIRATLPAGVVPQSIMSSSAAAGRTFARVGLSSNVLGTLRWLQSGEKYKTDTSDKHQLLYLMEGKGSIELEHKKHDVSKGMGVYLGPLETATIQASAPVKIFHLVVPQIPK